MPSRPYVPSLNVAGLRESATIAVSTRAKALRAAGHPVIDLGAGEPDFPTPDYIIQATQRALEAGATRYTVVEGIAPLRALIAARATAMYGGGDPIVADEIVVSTGAKQALFNACFALFGAGDEVLVPTPAWTSYYEMLRLARATPIVVRGARSADLKVTPDDLLRAAAPRTRGVVLNSPTNPTGAVYSRDELRALLRCATEQGWWVVSDEIYREIAYEGEAPSALSVAETRDRLIVVDGVAKAYAMTGFRIGWSIAPRSVSRSMMALQSHTTSNASTLSQHATLGALEDVSAARASITRMVAAFRERRDSALEILRAAGADVIEPRGAFYLYVHVASGTTDDPEPGTRLARRVLEEQNVAVVPGAAFHSPEWIRLSYAASTDQVLEGVRRIVAAGIS